MNLRDIAITSALALSGVALWSHGANRLAAANILDYTPNPLGIKGSPYGAVVALAMQGGIESDWHGSAKHSDTSSCTCGHHNDSQEHECPPLEKATTPRSFIENIELAATERTNPSPATSGHRLYLRRQTENKLRLAYELDPSNYGNYNSYQLFLTEPSVGTRPIMTKQVVELASNTINYCLKENSDPRPALTAASAASNILELMFAHQENYTLEQMKQQLQVLDYSLGKHRALTNRWIVDGEFQNLSPARQQEMIDRLYFVEKVREASAKTVERLESQASDQASNSY